MVVIVKCYASFSVLAITFLFHFIQVKGAVLRLWILKGHQTSQGPNDSASSPVCRFVNVQLCGSSPGTGVKGNHATVLLENPQGEHLLTRDQFLHQVRTKRLLYFIWCSRFCVSVLLYLGKFIFVKSSIFGFEFHDNFRISISIFCDYRVCGFTYIKN